MSHVFTDMDGDELSVYPGNPLNAGGISITITTGHEFDRLVDASVYLSPKQAEELTALIEKYIAVPEQPSSTAGQEGAA